MGRVFDIVASAAGVVIASPLLVLIAGAVKLYDGGPIFYRARRVGRGGEHFDLYKFRTMVRDADRQGPGITVSGDSRVTPIGRLLRKTKLDEIPQLVNVLKGEMSVVGPRPEDPRYVEIYTAEQMQILDARPGLTSAASLRYRNEEELLAGHNWETIYREQILPAKIHIDLEYLSRRTVWSDVKIIFKTLFATFD